MTFRDTRTTRHRFWLAIAGVAFGLLAPAAAEAATVANTNDSGPGSLRQAIADATPGETINVPAGEYVLTSGRLEIGTSVNIVGAGSTRTTISGDDNSQVVNIEDPEEERVVEISGVTIRDGRVGPGEEVGAGIDAGPLKTLLLHDVTIAHNLADATALHFNPGEQSSTGASALLVSAQRFVMADSRVVDNVTRAPGFRDHPAGAIEGGTILASSNLIAIERSTIAGNSVDASGEPGKTGGEIFGGAILAAPGSLPEEKLAVLRVVDSTIANNRATAMPGIGGAGGFVQGGGIEVLTEQTHDSFSGDTIVDNEVRSGSTGIAQGGGVALISVFQTSTFAFTNSTIASNSAIGSPSGGAGGNVFQTGFFALLHTHRFDGKAEPIFANTIVSHGVGAPGSENCGAEEGQPRPVSLGFNLDSLNQCSFHSPGDLVNRDPLLGALQDNGGTIPSNGGPTETMLPAPNSPVLDQGSRFGQGTDQRGFARPVDLPAVPNSTAPGADGSDIGAVELQGSSGR